MVYLPKTIRDLFLLCEKKTFLRKNKKRRPYLCAARYTRDTRDKSCAYFSFQIEELNQPKSENLLLCTAKLVKTEGFKSILLAFKILTGF